MHEKRRDHACRYCPIAFQTASDLTTHVHEMLRDHTCRYCPSAFQTASHLRKHVRVVHEKCRDHKCPHCPYACGQAGNLRKHVRTQHRANNSQNEVADRSPSPAVAAGTLLSADYIVAALLNR